MRMKSILLAFVFAFVVSEIHCIDESVTVCDGKSHKISCLGDHKIKITAADYGRTSKEVCPAFLFDKNTNCHSDNAFEITKEECDGFPECTLYANTDEYGNPCLFTVEYLTVSYKCVKAGPNDLQKVRVCEGNQQSINCGKRKVDVEYANYGRLKGGHVCGIFSWDKDCKAENSLSVVKEDCQDEHSCVLEANNDKFGGNPCWLTSKYLEVHFRCQK